MKVRQIQQVNGLALRIGLLPYRGRFSLMLLVTGLGMLAFFPWTRFLESESVNFSLLQLTLLAALWVVFSLAFYFARHVIQIDADRHIRKGFTILGFRIWMGKVAISRMAGLQPDPSDPDNPILKCVDPSGESILAIEGLRDTREAKRLAEYVWRQLDDHDTAVHEFVESIENSPPNEPRKSLRWMLVGVAFLSGIALSLWDPGSDLPHQLVSTTIAVTIAALGLVAVLPDEKITHSNADEGTISGWVRRGFFWIEDYTWEMKEDPFPTITRKRFDRRLTFQGLVLVIYGVLVFCIVSLPMIRNSGAKVDDDPRPQQSEEELENLRKGAERLKEVLEKRERESQ